MWIFIYIHALYMPAAKALPGLCNCAGSLESASFLLSAKSYKISPCVGSFKAELRPSHKLRVRIWQSLFLCLNQKICCGYSKEPSLRDGSLDHPKHIFKLMGKKIIANLHSILCLFLYSVFSGRILMDIPCKVCQDHSSGKHYGIYACDGYVILCYVHFIM